MLADLEAGEEVVIMRRGKPVARIVAEPAGTQTAFDLSALRAFVEAQPCREGLDLVDLREQDIL